MVNVTQSFNDSAYVDISVMDFNSLSQQTVSEVIDYSFIDQRVVIIALVLLSFQLARYILLKIIHKNFNKGKITIEQYKHKVELTEFFDLISFPAILFILFTLFHLF